MSKILFYDKEVKSVCPYYARHLLNLLKERGHQIFVIMGKPKSEGVRSHEEVANIRLSKIYEHYPSKYLNNLLDVKKVIEKEDPDIFLTDEKMFGFERKVLEYVCKQEVPSMEMDMVASEILNYHPLLNNFLFPLKGKYRIVNLYSAVKFFFRQFLTPFSNIEPNKLDLISERITVKGKFFQDFITSKNIEEVQRLIPITKIIPAREIETYSEASFPVTGSIQFDHLVNVEIPKEELFRDLGLDLERKTIIFAPTKYHLKGVDGRFIENSIRELKDKLDVNLVINPHPSDRVEFPNRFKKFDLPILPAPFFYKVLHYSDLLISPISTIGIETALCKVPVLFAEHHKTHPALPYFKDKYNSAHSVTSKDIVTTVRKIFSGEIRFSYENFVEDMCYKDDGRSYIRVADELEKLLDQEDY